ncbi:MAG: bifunctional glutamine synthetase adenylyltransferase/deadenyltransferase, partial [Rhodocyclales bacterium]|nr:bifunctional glutamine synthetase adenylyltransferase/deadenyltransferase [Rhodocyclales bacterium]
PSFPQDSLRIAMSMGFPSVDALMVALDAHRVIVSRHFDGVFSDPAAGEISPDARLAGAWSSDSEVDSVCTALENFGYHDKKNLCDRLRTFRDGPRYRAMSEEGRARLDTVVPRVLALAAARANPDQTLIRMIELLEAICRRAAYLALLQQYPLALERVVELVSSSSWAANYLTRHPLLLDELLDNRNLSEGTDNARFAAELSFALDALGDDTERQMDLMREAHHAQVFRLLNRDLAGDLTVEALSDKLSELADIVLGETLKQCWKKLVKRHADTHRFAIIGYGKLGGKELGYASDLDIVFLHDDPDPEAQPVYARLAQRINTWISSRTSAGLLFEVDLRLRPNGDSGLLVSSVEAFEKYQRESAWVWEHQALTRARFCAGHSEVGAHFERLRHDLLCQPRDLAKLRSEVVAMRKKMMDAHANKGEGFQLKHDAGGLVHVEFIVQYLVLAYAHQWPELAADIGNIALLKLAANVGLLPADIAHAAADAYRQLRHAQHLLRLNEHDSRMDDDSLAGAREAVARLWQSVFEAL